MEDGFASQTGVQVIPISNQYREGWDRIFKGGIFSEKDRGLGRREVGCAKADCLYTLCAFASHHRSDCFSCEYAKDVK